MDQELLERLEQKAQHHAREAERYRIAADVIRVELRPQRPSARTRNDPGSSQRPATSAMVERLLNDSDTALHPNELLKALLEAGWVSDSPTPINTVRAAAHRLAHQGRVERVGDGRYGRLGIQALGDPDEQLVDDDSSMNEPATLGGTQDD